MINNEIFGIEEGVLNKYIGKNKKIIIPEGVKEIDRHVFSNCDFLEEIVLPDSIEEIDETNFEDCENLRFNEVNGVRYLGNKNNPYLILISSDDIKECFVQDGCKIIKGKAFFEHKTLLKVYIPSSVKYIGFMAFYDCEALSEIIFSEGLNKIDSCAFYNCNIKKIQLPNSITYIGSDAFSIMGLNEVVLPNNIKYIGSSAFTNNDLKFNEFEEGCYFGSNDNPYLCFVKPKNKDIKQINIHQDCNFIYSNAFLKCKKINSIKLPEGIIHINNDAFRECDMLESVILPEGLKVIDENSFASCARLKSINFPGNIIIESGAFIGCGLENIELKNVIIGDNVFSGCNELKKVIIEGDCNLYGDYIFSECTSLEEVVLPKNLEKRFTLDEFEDCKNIKVKYL